VKDGDRKITYVGAPESRTSSKRPYDKNVKHDNRKNKKNGERWEKRERPPINNNLDFAAIAQGVFK
jgi:hypothetical protein